MSIMTGRRASSTSAHHIIKVQLRRHLLVWWVWKVIAVEDDGSAPVTIASGANLSKARARVACESWQRIYLRRLGRYRSGRS